MASASSPSSSSMPRRLTTGRRHRPCPAGRSPGSPPPRRSTAACAARAAPRRRAAISAVAVARQPAGMDMVDDLGRPRRQPHQGAVGRHAPSPAPGRCRASAACSTMWRTSPCTGRAILGRTHWYMRTSSSRAGWPETWMWLVGPSVITSTPRAIRAFCRRPTGRSLPGITREEKIAVSPASSTRSRCSPVAMLGHRGARLALAAGADEQHLLARQVAGLLLR